MSKLKTTLKATTAPPAAQRVHSVCDQGHYGSTTCSNCGEDAGSGRVCTNCGVVFAQQDEVSLPSGGSDFPT